MVDIDTTCEHVDGVTFVSATVTNTRTTPQRVCLESTLPGPTWVPRCGTLTAPEWSGKRWEAVLESDRSRGLGFASPGQRDPSLESPLKVVAIERARTADSTTDPAVTLATLEEWSPTTDVLSSTR